MNQTCIQCGTINASEAKFCKKCGTALKATTSNLAPIKELDEIAQRAMDEKLYEQVAADLKHGIRKEGLYAKALADANGAVEFANAIYIKYAVQSLQDELTLQIEQERKFFEQKKAIQEQQLSEEEEIKRKEQIKIEKELKDQREMKNWNIGIFIVILIALVVMIKLL